MKKELQRLKMKKRGKIKINWFTVAIFSFLALYAVSLLLPLFWGALNSLKTPFDYDTNRLGVPDPFTGVNFQQALKLLYVPVPFGKGSRNVLIPELMMNSVLYALGCAFFQTLCCCLMAYVSQRFTWKICKVIYGIVIITMILPIVGAMPSELRILKAIGLYDTIPGGWLLRANFLGVYFLVFYETFRSIPRSFSEAARIDGAGDFGVLFRIMLPLAAKTFGAVMLIYFVGYWNDYQVPLVYIPTHPTLTYAMYTAALSTRISSVPERLAVCLIVFIPIFIVFMIFQKKIMGNVSMGGLKE